MEANLRNEGWRRAGEVIRAILNPSDGRWGRGGDAYVPGKIKELETIVEGYKNRNAWFTPETIYHQLHLASNWLVDDYGSKVPPEPPENNQPCIGLVYRPLYPLQALEDLLALLFAGHSVRLLQQHGTDRVMQWLVQLLQEHSEAAVQIVDAGIGNTDGIVVWKYEDNPGMNRYFNGKRSLVRERTASLGVLSGNESREILDGFARDMVMMMGLSHHNISKLLVPENYDFSLLFKAIEQWEEIRLHHKFANNHDYHRSVYIMTQQKFLDNGFFLFTESEKLFAPPPVVYYETYRNETELVQKIKKQKAVQQWVASVSLPVSAVTPGTALNRSAFDFKGQTHPVEWLQGLK